MNAMQKRSLLLTLNCDANTAYVSGKPSPYLTSSQSDMAWRIGLWKRERGMTAPKDIAPSRGYTWLVDDMKVSFANGSNPERIA
jgi:hypothetical protein